MAIALREPITGVLGQSPSGFQGQSRVRRLGSHWGPEAERHSLFDAQITTKFG